MKRCMCSHAVRASILSTRSHNYELFVCLAESPYRDSKRFGTAYYEKCPPQQGSLRKVGGRAPGTSCLHSSPEHQRTCRDTLPSKLLDDRTRDYSSELKDGRFTLGIRRKRCTVRVARHWDCLSREVKGVPALKC